MPDWDCPAGDYTASGTDEAETAQILIDHLVKMHAKTPFPLPKIDPTLLDGVLGGTEAKVRAKGGPAEAEVEAERR